MVDGGDADGRPRRRSAASIAAAHAERDAARRGSWPAPARELAAERDALPRLQADGRRTRRAPRAARSPSSLRRAGGDRVTIAGRAAGRLASRHRRRCWATRSRSRATCPLVLLPVRIEVRSTPDRATLRVRIFHDAVHAEALDEGLSRRRARGRHRRTGPRSGPTATPPGPGRRSSRRRPRGGRRGWPRRCARRTSTPRPAAPPEFPDTPPRAGRPAVARTLPDRFFVRIEQDGAAPSPSSAATPIPDELPVGLAEQRRARRRCRSTTQDLPPIDESLRWLVDYAEAERVGMAVTVPLAGRPARPVRTASLVYGVRAALDPAASAARLEHLAARAPLHRRRRVRRPGHADQQHRVGAAPTGAGARRPAPPTLATAASLGSGANARRHGRRARDRRRSSSPPSPGAADAEQARAAAFNTALWTTTWGDAIEHLTPPGSANGDQRLDSPSLDGGARPLDRPRPRPRAAAGAAPRPAALRRAAGRRDGRHVAAAAAADSSRTALGAVHRPAVPPVSGRTRRPPCRR